MTVIRKLLVANRGEIADRIVRSARVRGRDSKKLGDIAWATLETGGAAPVATGVSCARLARTGVLRFAAPAGAATTIEGSVITLIAFRPTRLVTVRVIVCPFEAPVVTV